MTIDKAQIDSMLRHVYTGLGVATAVLTAVGWSQGDVTAIGTAVHQIGDGLASVAIGVGTLVTIGSTAYAGWQRRRKAITAEVDALPEVAGVIMKPTLAGRELATAVPSPTVVTAGTPEATAIAAR